MPFEEIWHFFKSFKKICLLINSNSGQYQYRKAGTSAGPYPRNLAVKAETHVRSKRAFSILNIVD